MTNFEWVKSLNEQQMAAFINQYRPSCNEMCKDAKEDCARECKRGDGNDVIEKWLHLEINDETDNS